MAQLRTIEIIQLELNDPARQENSRFIRPLPADPTHSRFSEVANPRATCTWMCFPTLFYDNTRITWDMFLKNIISKVFAYVISSYE